MKAILGPLECRGWGAQAGLSRRRGIAGIIDEERHRAGLDRPFVIDTATGQHVRPLTDRKGASGSFNTGVALWFVLESGRTYEVRCQTSWRGRETFQCTVTNDGEIIRL